MKQYIEALYQDSSLGALMKANTAVAPLNAKEYEAAVKVVYQILFKDKVPHNRRAEIMKYNCWEGKLNDLATQVNAKHLSNDDLTLVARFFGAEACTREDLARFLATPTATLMAALRAGPAKMDLD